MNEQIHLKGGDQPSEVINNLEAFRDKLQTFFLNYAQEIGFTGKPSSVQIEVGRKYARVLRVDTGRSAYCFVEVATGDIFKPASFKGPAKHKRGNISQPDAELFGEGKVCGPYGVAYLR